MASVQPESLPLELTWEGHIATTTDAVILFEACLSGLVSHVPRRPHDRERPELIKSGSIFIYEEHSSGIKRWTDGVSWSPSRILGNFLIYRELEKPFPPGEKKRALKKSKKCPASGIIKPEPSPRSASISFPTGMGEHLGRDSAKEAERCLIGSLVDSYPFKDDGLVKKTISITYQGIPHHLVSYYNVRDVMSKRLQVPSKAERFAHIVPRQELMTSQNFRSPLVDLDSHDVRDGPPHPAYIAAAALISDHEYQHVSVPPSLGGRHYSLPDLQSQQQNYQNVSAYNLSTHQTQPAAYTLNPSPISYASLSGGNYALEPSRAPRFNSTAGFEHEFPRNMPTDHNSQRRHSTFDTPMSTELSVPYMPESRPMAGHNAYLATQQYYATHIQPRTGALPDTDSYTSPQMKVESELAGDDATPQFHGLEQDSEGGQTWFDQPVDSANGQYYDNSRS